MITFPLVLFIIFFNQIILFIKSIFKLRKLNKSLLSIFLIFIVFIISIQNQNKFNHLLQFSDVFSYFDKNNDSCAPILNSIQARLTYFTTGLKVFKENIFFGIGPQNFYQEMCEFQFRFNSNIADYPSMHPHSLILHILSELGLVGGGLFLINIIQIIINVNNKLNNQKSYITNLDHYFYMIWQFEFINSLINESYLTGFFFPLLTGLLVSIIYKENKPFKSNIIKNKMSIFLYNDNLIIKV